MERWGFFGLEKIKKGAVPILSGTLFAFFKGLFKARRLKINIPPARLYKHN